MAQYPVIVHGASGYTGMLIMDWLIDQRIPFTAIGRERQARRDSKMRERVVRLESAEYEIIESEHEVEALAKAFSGGKVVCNTVGPFVDLGLIGVEAALKAGCHHLDTTGEQSYVLDARDQFGADYAEGEPRAGPVDVLHVHHGRDRGRARARASRRRHARDRHHLPRSARGGRRHGRVDRVDLPADRATRSTTCGTARWLPTSPARAIELNVPELMRPVFALPWSGTSLPAFYEHDSRVRYCDSSSGSTTTRSCGWSPTCGASGRPSTRTCRPSSRTRSSRSWSSRRRRKCRRASALRCSGASTSRSAAAR